VTARTRYAASRLKYNVVAQNIVAGVASETGFPARATSSSRRRPTQNHERIASPEPRQELQITAGLFGICPWRSRARGSWGCWGRTSPARPRPSTLMVGLTRCEQGEIYLDKPRHQPPGLATPCAAGTGYLPQEPSVFTAASRGGQHYGDPRDPDGGWTKGGRTARLKELLGELHIGHVRDSLGMSSVRGRAPPGGNRPGLGGGSQVHLAGRTVRRRRPPVRCRIFRE